MLNLLLVIFAYTYSLFGASLVAQRLKRLPTMQETWVWSLGWEHPLKKEMATHSSILAWRIPWTEEPGGLQSTGWQRVGHNWATSVQFVDCLTLSSNVSFYRYFSKALLLIVNSTRPVPRLNMVLKVLSPITLVFFLHCILYHYVYVIIWRITPSPEHKLHGGRSHT